MDWYIASNNDNPEYVHAEQKRHENIEKRSRIKIKRPRIPQRDDASDKKQTRDDANRNEPPVKNWVVGDIHHAWSVGKIISTSLPLVSPLLSRVEPANENKRHNRK